VDTNKNVWFIPVSTGKSSIESMPPMKD
jgi:hypothetical protein